MKILPPGLAFALGLAVAAGAEPRSADAGAKPRTAHTAGGPVLLIVDEQGAKASGIADAMSAIESSAPAASTLPILLIPVTGGACEAPRAATTGMPYPAPPVHPTM